MCNAPGVGCGGWWPLCVTDMRLHKLPQAEACHLQPCVITQLTWRQWCEQVVTEVQLEQG